MHTFTTHGFEIVNTAISQETAKLLSTEFEILRRSNFLINGRNPSEIGFLNDSMVPKSFSWYSPFCFEALMVLLHSKMEHTIKKKLLPSYSYGRIYYHGADLKKHIDRPSCEYSASITLETDSNLWPIWIDDLYGNSHEVNLNVGDMIVYKGSVLRHWREPFNGNRQIQAFIHFVDEEGPFKDYVFDRRENLGMPVKNSTAHQVG